MTFADRPATSWLPYAAALATLLVAGCTSSSPAPPVGSSTAPVTASTSPSAPATSSTAEPTTTAPPSPTTTVDPVLARIPKAARPETKEGAAAFTEFYFGELNAAFKKADPKGLEDLSTSTCEVCASLAQGVRDVRSEGHHYGADLIQVKYATPNDFTDNKRNVLVSLIQSRVPVLNSAGKKVASTSGAPASFVVTMDFTKHWVITNLARVSS